MTKRLFLDRVDTVRKYYTSPKFALIDITFAFLSLFMNPYRICRKFLQKRKAVEIYAYGETPFTTYEKIVEECHISSQDTWIELGSGRGKGCFWLAHFTRCKVVGIEWIPQFVFFATAIKSLFRMHRITFLKGDIEKAMLPPGSIIYLYGLWPSMEFPKDAKIITISEPLNGYKVIHSFWVRFPWGRTRAFFQANSS